MTSRKEDRMEVLFGFFGTQVSAILLITAAFLSPGYTPLKDAVSSLGWGNMKSLFSISFVVSGSLCIPFYIYLERELINIKDNIRRLATGVSIFTCVCIALVGIIPDETYLDIFVLFHIFVAAVSFIGSALYIVLYSYLMYIVPKAKMYEGPKFKKYIAYLGFSIGIILILFLITLFFFNNAIIEWILTICIYLWITLTAIHLISYKFFNIPGIYYKRSEYPEALKKFEDAIQILDRLDLSEEPISETLKENIEFLKKELEEKT
ncbi:MAG: DUF998 domain-containing protein [Promethearchaeota archaeon]|nr:MAG: DUF998 domain-containing protein [Candidatus Lokiarchaeota archaeon]